MTKRGSFTYVYKKGRVVKTRCFVFYYLASSGLRAGFSVNNKLGKAVKRNKIKRRLRSAFRTIMPLIKGNGQLVFMCRSAITEADYGEILSDMRLALLRAELIDA